MPTCGVGKVAGLSAMVGAPMAMLCCTGVAGSKLVSPAWLAVTTQVPTWSKRTLLPVIEQMAREPALMAIAGVSPELAVAATR